MQRLILLRHGHAVPASAGKADFDRALTARGRDDARRIGRWLADRGERIELALVSPAVRARQTWEEAGAAFPDAEVQSPRSLYNAEPADMLQQAEAADAGTVVIVAHNPGLHVLALQLTTTAAAPASVLSALRSEFPPAAAVIFARGPSGVLTAETYQSPADLSAGVSA